MFRHHIYITKINKIHQFKASDWLISTLIVLSHSCPTVRPGCKLNDLISHSILFPRYRANQSLPNPINVEHQYMSDKYKCCKSLVWLGRGLNQNLPHCKPVIALYQLGDQCSWPSTWHVLFYGGYVYEGIFRPINHLHSDWSLHAAIQCVAFTVHIGLWIYGSTPIVILYFCVFITFAFAWCTSGISGWQCWNQLICTPPPPLLCGGRMSWASVSHVGRPGDLDLTCLEP